MTRSSSEIKSLINELEQGFPELRTRARERYSQLYADKAYQALLVSQFPLELSQRIPYASRRLNNAARQTVGILDLSLRYHVEAMSKLKGDEKTADKLELLFGHAFAVKFREDVALRPDTHRHQAVSPFAAWWLEWEKFELPKDKEKRQSYRENYWPFKLSVIDPLSVSFMADDNGIPTIAARHFDLPYIEVAKRYGGAKDDAHALRIMGQKYGYLRGGRGQAVDSVGDLYTKKAKVWVLDDANTISHYCEVKGEYQELNEQEIPNPWGATSLTVITGGYNAEAEDLADRYEPLLEDMRRGCRNFDTLRSYMISIALQPQLWGEILPPEAVTSALVDEKAVPPTELQEGRLTALRGKPEAIGQMLQEGTRFLLEDARMEVELLQPPAFLTSPDPLVISRSTATGFLAANGTSQRLYDDARGSEVAGHVDVCKKMIHFIQHYLNKPGQGTEAKEELYFTVAGKETTKKYRGGDEKGRDIVITPDDVADFEEKYILEITTEATTQSQKIAQFESVLEQYKAGAATLKDLIEATTEDVEGKVFEIEETRRYQQLVPIMDRLDLLAAIESIRLESGRDYSALAMPFLAGMDKLAAKQSDAPSGDEASAGGPQMMQPPATDSAPVGAMA